MNFLLHLKESSVLECMGPDCNGSTVNVWFRSGHMARLSRNVQLWENWATRSLKRQIRRDKTKSCFQLYLQHFVLTPHKTVQHVVNKSYPLNEKEWTRSCSSFLAVCQGLYNFTILDQFHLWTNTKGHLLSLHCTFYNISTLVAPADIEFQSWT